MKVWAGLAVAAVMLQIERHHAPPELKRLQFERAVTVDAGSGSAACAVLDADVYAHTRNLADMRLFADGQEVPYALSESQTELRGDAATVLNLGMAATSGLAQSIIVFDLAMPARAYSDVDLELAGTDFLATAKVTGRQSTNDKGGVALGSFTLFDLTGQRLGRSTTLSLSEASFPVLHVELQVGYAAVPHTSVAANLDVNPRAGHGEPRFDASMVRGAEVPPSRQAQTLYTTVARTTQVLQRERESVAGFALAARVPVERVSFEMAAGDKTNFSRAVQVSAKVAEAEAPETLTGEISRVRVTLRDREIRHEALGFAAVLGANAVAPAKVEVAVENGDDRPLAISAVRLEMRERKVCFDVPAGRIMMRYGDKHLEAPVYDYSRIFDPQAPVRVAVMAAETGNPSYSADVNVDRRTFADKHPELIWVGLLGVVGALGVVAFRSAKKT